MKQTEQTKQTSKAKPDSNYDDKMHKYELIIFWSEEDGRYIVEVPELPGCMADGLTYEEAIKNAEVVISEWVETAQRLGREIPQPKGRLAYA
jgi:predicted RNase H-like HicB family nuclease